MEVFRIVWITSDSSIYLFDREVFIKLSFHCRIRYKLTLINVENDTRECDQNSRNAHDTEVVWQKGVGWIFGWVLANL